MSLILSLSVLLVDSADFVDGGSSEEEFSGPAHPADEKFAILRRRHVQARRRRRLQQVQHLKQREI